MKNISTRPSSFYFLLVMLLSLQVLAMEENVATRLAFEVGSAIIPKPIHGINATCEDIIRIEANHPLPFFAIFDGHHGSQSAEYADRNLYTKLCKYGFTDKIADFTDDNIRLAFQEIGQEINLLKGNRSGSTAVVAFFSSLNGKNYLHTAHIGDSIAVLASFKYKFEATRLTKPHRPDNENDDQKNWETRTGLGITRSFGHPHLVKKKGLTFSPDILHAKLHPDDKFIILMSDGVHDHITDDEAIRFVWSKMQENVDLNQIARELIIQAARNDKRNPYRQDEILHNLKIGIRDDMSVVIAKIIH